MFDISSQFVVVLAVDVIVLIASLFSVFSLELAMLRAAPYVCISFVWNLHLGLLFLGGILPIVSISVPLLQ